MCERNKTLGYYVMEEVIILLVTPSVINYKTILKKLSLNTPSVA